MGKSRNRSCICTVIVCISRKPCRATVRATCSPQGQGQKKTLEKKKEEVYSRLQVKLDKIENMDSVKNAITEMGLQVHGAGEWMREIEKQSTTIQMVLGGIGSIALIVAAIGIANTMIMSTYERTREIGVMKVIGATVGDVRNLFLFEAAIIGFLGGLFGLLTSHGVSYLLNNVQIGRAHV